MPPLPRLVLLGAGGHASDVLGVVEALNERKPTFEVVGLLDDDPEVDTARFDWRHAPLLGGVDQLGLLDASWVAAVGWPGGRRRLAQRAAAMAQAAPAMVSPTADVGACVSVGCGSVVMGGARLSPHARVGDHALVSYLAAVGHDSVIGDGTSVMPGAMVSGEVQVGAEVLVGTNATILEGLRLGDGATIGAGAVVVENVAEGTTVVGVPARLVTPGRSARSPRRP